MSDFTIRNVLQADVKACHTIEQLCFRPSEAASVEAIQERARVFPQGFLVAEQGGEVIGFINSGLTAQQDLADDRLKGAGGHDPNGKNLVIYSVAVHPDSQGLGVAARLLRDFLQQVRPMDIQAILLLCQPELVPYYARFGFRHAGPSASTHGGVAWHEMKLSL